MIVRLFNDVVLNTEVILYSVGWAGDMSSCVLYRFTVRMFFSREGKRRTHSGYQNGFVSSELKWGRTEGNVISDKKAMMLLDYRPDDMAW
jgi:hypothetical protein